MKMPCPMNSDELIEVSLDASDKKLCVECSHGGACQNVIEGKCAWATRIEMNVKKTSNPE